MKKSLLVYSALLFVIGINLNSQTITTSPLSAGEFCAGQSISVTYTAQGTFQSDNLFVVQLSINNFQNFTNIGNLISTSSGVISAVIPGDFNPSSLCRIRVISTNPYIEGNNNGSDFSVFSKYFGSVDVLSDKPIGSIDSLFIFRFNYDSLKTSSAKWNFGKDAIPGRFTGLNPPNITYSSTGKKLITCEAVSSLNCSKQSIDTTSIYVYGCDVSIDSNAILDSIINDPDNKLMYAIHFSPEYSQFWMLPGASMTDYFFTRDYVVYIMESGTNFKAISIENSIFYLKPGASLSLESTRFCTFIKSPGASLSIPDPGYNKVIECNSLKINYKAAPQGGVQYMVSRGYLDVEENQALMKDFCISPNPASDFIEISLGTQQAMPLQIGIYDVFGREVNNSITTSMLGAGENNPLNPPLLRGNLRIDVSSLSPGLYFVRVGERVGKFVKL